MKNVSPLAILVLFIGILASACNVNSTTIQSSGNLITETRNVQSFNAVTFGGNAHADIVRDGTESLTITVADNVMPHMQIEVNNGRLYVQPKPNLMIENDRGYTVTLTVKNLESLSLLGNSNARVNGIETTQWKAELNGNCFAALYGSAARQEIVVDGNSFYDAANLTSSQATVQADGNSHVTIRVSDKLDVTVKALSVVEYIGNPYINQKIENLASVKQRMPY